MTSNPFQEVQNEVKAPARSMQQQAGFLQPRLFKPTLSDFQVGLSIGKGSFGSVQLAKLSDEALEAIKSYDNA
jgi:hypothetical protein